MPKVRRRDESPHFNIADAADTLEALLGSSHELEGSLRSVLALLNLYDEKAIGKELGDFYSRAGNFAETLDQLHMEILRYTDQKVSDYTFEAGQL